MGVSEHEVERVLIPIAEKLRTDPQKGYLAGLSKEQVNQLVSTVAKKIAANNDLTSYHLKDVQFKETLGLVLATTFVAQVNPRKSFDETILFRKMPMRQLQDILEKEIEKSLAEANKLNPQPGKKPLSPEAIKAIAKIMAAEIYQDFVKSERQTFLYENQKALNLFTDLYMKEMQALKALPPRPEGPRKSAEPDPAEEALRNLYSMSPDKPGSITSVVQAIVGNYAGISDQNGLNETSFAAIDEFNRADWKPDPAGSENENRKRLLGLGSVYVHDTPSLDKKNPSSR